MNSEAIPLGGNNVNPGQLCETHGIASHNSSPRNYPDSRNYPESPYMKHSFVFNMFHKFQRCKHQIEMRFISTFNFLFVLSFSHFPTPSIGSPISSNLTLKKND